MKYVNDRKLDKSCMVAVLFSNDFLEEAKDIIKMHIFIFECKIC